MRKGLVISASPPVPSLGAGDVKMAVVSLFCFFYFLGVLLLILCGRCEWATSMRRYVIRDESRGCSTPLYFGEDSYHLSVNLHDLDAYCPSTTAKSAR